LKIKSQIKSPYFNMILKISKSSQNDLKSDFVKSSIKSLNTLLLHHMICSSLQTVWRYDLIGNVICSGIGV
jgi:hypothetical protein